MWNYYITGTEFPFGTMKKSWKWTVVMVTHHCEYY